MESSTSELRLEVRGQRLAVMAGSPPEPVPEGLAAIPGVPVVVDGASWAVLLGPDRAASLSKLVEAHQIPTSEACEAALAALAASRDLDDPVVEITRNDGTWLSLMDDWQSLALEMLRTVGGSRPRPAVGRVEVPLTRWTAQTIEDAVLTHGVRLSPTAELALEELLDHAATPHAAEAPAYPEATETNIALDDGGYLVLTASPGTEASREFASLDGSRSWGTHSARWLAPTSPESARSLRRLATEDPDLTFDEASRRWLDEAPRWIARVELDTAVPPRLKIVTRWGEAPSLLTELEQIESQLSHQSAPLSTANLKVVERLRQEEPELAVAPGVDNALEWLEANPDATSVPPAQLDLLDDDGPARLRLDPIWSEDPENAFVQQESLLLRRHREFHPDADELPASAWPQETLAKFIRIHRVACTPAAARLVQGVYDPDADIDRLVALSSAHDADIEVEGLGGELMPFQRAGVAYALERRRLFLADEQGLGKTIQALATVQADEAYPAIVICPASLKLNWLREIKTWLPSRTAKAITGRRAQDLTGTDIVVLNYEIVEAHVEGLQKLAPEAMVLDEAHYVKNSKAARTRAVLNLAQELSPDALRLALTGTPVVNHPAELAPQLKALNRLAEYGTATSFKRGYMTDVSRRRLHRELRGSCYLRRRKDDVLEQLPAKRRAVVTVPIDNEPEYRRAENDFIQWLREQVDEDDGRLAPGRRAEAIVRMTALRKLAAHGKLAAAMAWLADFAESEEKLIVFAHHRDIQSAVYERFPDSAQIVGTDSMEDREANVRRFQGEDGPPFCVASLEVGSHGHTLTAAANVAFLELAWTPAKHDQAEDRAHRIGQTDSVTAWYLLAAGTIDERIAELLEAKREVVDSITDGGGGGGQSLAAALIDGYATD